MIHHVFANRSNVGDWLSAIGIRTLLGGLPVREHLCDAPFVPGTLRTLRDAAPDDLVVVGGGGLFMDYFTPFWEGLLADPPQAPLVLWGVGLVDLKREDSRPPRSLVERAAGSTAVCAVRDALTRDWLAAVPDVEVVPCPSLLAVPASGEAEPALLHAANYTTAGAEAYEAMREAGIRFAADTGRTYRETNNRIEKDSREGLRATLALYARSELVLTSRLHGCLIALAMGRPVVAVSGDAKIDALMRAAGLEEWMCDIGDVERVGELLRRAAAERPRGPGFVAEAARLNRAVGARVRAVHGGGACAAARGATGAAAEGRDRPGGGQAAARRETR